MRGVMLLSLVSQLLTAAAVQGKSNSTVEIYLQGDGESVATYSGGEFAQRIVRSGSWRLAEEWAAEDHAKTSFLIQDHLGSTAATLDYVGTVQSCAVRWPFGEDVLSEQAAECDVEARFTGQKRELISQWYDYRARFFDPTLGRFMGVDPQARSYPAMSPFAYAANNPTRYIDPTGEVLFIPPAVYGAVTTAGMFMYTPMGQRMIEVGTRFAQGLASQAQLMAFFDDDLRVVMNGTGVEKVAAMAGMIGGPAGEGMSRIARLGVLNDELQRLLSNQRFQSALNAWTEGYADDPLARRGVEAHRDAGALVVRTTQELFEVWSQELLSRMRSLGLAVSDEADAFRRNRMPDDLRRLLTRTGSDEETVEFLLEIDTAVYQGSFVSSQLQDVFGPNFGLR